ncbi:Transcriptional regulator, XRE family [Thiomonas sp. Bio17B3]|nr:Transcriptional regulator, XRE family [Thiomonas sp. Bio17B3]VDY09773.1 Transcriptional regulator, XRE family [Thiomonas sp. Sup16B3]VDY15204.1 putative Transcriptional regulator, XRE family [Thiomonas sp. OC7]
MAEITQSGLNLFAQPMRAVESLDDVALFDAVKAADDGSRVLGAIAHAILDGAHPVKAWREYRGLTQDALAEKAGISKAYLSQIETGKRIGVAKTLKALAAALGVTLNEIQP